MAHKLAFLHALSPLHSGTGQGVGAIDLPIHRERATNLPLVPGSTIKGCLRDSLHGDDDVKALFGPETEEIAPDSAFAGALRASDAHILLLPVRSLGSTFVWATCPFLLHRLHRDAAIAGYSNLPAVPSLDDGQSRVAGDQPLVQVAGQPRLVLEDLDFASSADGALPWCQWISSHLFPNQNDPWRGEMTKRFAIIDDNSFDYLAEFATEITAHIRIEHKTGTVKQGALWYQEALPAETVLYFLLQADKPYNGAPLSPDEVLAKVQPTNEIQFGGKAGTGLGMVRLVPFGA